MNPPLIAIIGPTAVGKTDLSLIIAERFDGEVVSADSRQIYQHMNIGTAKATQEERSRVRHHLIDIVEPDERITLASYQKQAYQAIDNILQRNKLPLLVGGTGLYIRAVLEGWQIPEVPPNHTLRAKLRRKAEQLGGDVLHEAWTRNLRKRSILTTYAVSFEQ